MVKRKELLIVLFTVAAMCIGCGSTQTSTVASTADTEQTGVELQTVNSDDNPDIAKYNGQMVKGSDVRQAIKDLKDSGIAILVNSGEGTVEYLNHVGSSKLEEKVESTGLTDDVMSTTANLQNSDSSGDWGGSGSYSDLMKLAKDESKVGFYIPQDGDYVGMICRDSDGKISALRFVWQGVPYSQRDAASAESTNYIDAEDAVTIESTEDASGESTEAVEDTADATTDQTADTDSTEGEETTESASSESATETPGELSGESSEETAEN